MSRFQASLRFASAISELRSILVPLFPEAGFSQFRAQLRCKLFICSILLNLGAGPPSLVDQIVRAETNILSAFAKRSKPSRAGLTGFKFF
jgi:hypothetical protein